MNIAVDNEAVMRRLHEVFGVRTDVALAAALDLPGTTVASWRQRGGVPGHICIRLAIERAVRLDWLMFGIGPMHRADVEAMQARPKQVDRQLLLRSVREVVGRDLSIDEIERYMALVLREAGQ